jgi:hypothetical protein
MKKSFLIGAFMAIQGLSAAPTADFAILLDTSGSMGGLISQVRDGLWKTLNGLGKLKRDGVPANLRLALYEYGSGVVSAEANYIQQLTALTTDHTKLAEALFATVAQGGEEYSGMVIQNATNDLAWTQLSEDFRSIVIAGNETIQQGPVEPLLAAKGSLKKDVIVNTIFAGPQTFTSFSTPSFGCRFFCPTPNPTPGPVNGDPQGESKVNPIFLEWKNLAQAGGGEVLNIDHNQAQPYIESPFDESIIKLTEEVNKTFLPFGKDGETEFNRMITLDRNIRSSGGGSYMDWGNYRGGNFGVRTQSSWDLVSASLEDGEEKVDMEALLNKLTVSELPVVLKGQTIVNQFKIINTFVKKRESLEQQITELRIKRATFVEQELQSSQNEGEITFSDAIRDILVKQLQQKGFTVQ